MGFPALDSCPYARASPCLGHGRKEYSEKASALSWRALSGLLARPPPTAIPSRLADGGRENRHDSMHARPRPSSTRTPCDLPPRPPRPPPKNSIWLSKSTRTTSTGHNELLAAWQITTMNHYGFLPFAYQGGPYFYPGPTATTKPAASQCEGGEASSSAKGDGDPGGTTAAAAPAAAAAGAASTAMSAKTPVLTSKNGFPLPYTHTPLALHPQSGSPPIALPLPPQQHGWFGTGYSTNGIFDMLFNSPSTAAPHFGPAVVHSVRCGPESPDALALAAMHGLSTNGIFNSAVNSFPRFYNAASHGAVAVPQPSPYPIYPSLPTAPYTYRGAYPIEGYAHQLYSHGGHPNGFANRMDGGGMPGGTVGEFHGMRGMMVPQHAMVGYGAAWPNVAGEMGSYRGTGPAMGAGLEGAYPARTRAGHPPHYP
ncbi:uncharacterized protein VTP21DRAFT_5413 [Calcarisporiella thermophila]|uniref:uncharacterized protein n=1 Tax=Calcarisporiella thermophila TaxID=911321 RepID=UPI003743832C